jgi:hypothetical protein
MKTIDEIFARVAKNNNLTVQEMKREMEIAIDHAWEHNDNIKRSFKTKPTPEQVILKSISGAQASRRG